MREGSLKFFPNRARKQRHWVLATSLGVAHFPEHGQTAEELVSHADIAMYQAKRLGKNRWTNYRPDRDTVQAMDAN